MIDLLHMIVLIIHDNFGANRSQPLICINFERNQFIILFKWKLITKQPQEIKKKWVLFYPFFEKRRLIKWVKKYPFSDRDPFYPLMGKAILPIKWVETVFAEMGTFLRINGYFTVTVYVRTSSNYKHFQNNHYCTPRCKPCRLCRLCIYCAISYPSLCTVYYFTFSFSELISLFLS